MHEEKFTKRGLKMSVLCSLTVFRPNLEKMNVIKLIHGANNSYRLIFIAFFFFISNDMYQKFTPSKMRINIKREYDEVLNIKKKMT